MGMIREREYMSACEITNQRHLQGDSGDTTRKVNSNKTVCGFKGLVAQKRTSNREGQNPQMRCRDP